MTEEQMREAKLIMDLVRRFELDHGTPETLQMVRAMVAVLEGVSAESEGIQGFTNRN